MFFSVSRLHYTFSLHYTCNFLDSCKGIGEKTAAKLLQSYGTLDKIAAMHKNGQFDQLLDPPKKKKRKKGDKAAPKAPKAPIGVSRLRSICEDLTRGIADGPASSSTLLSRELVRLRDVPGAPCPLGDCAFAGLEAAVRPASRLHEYDFPGLVKEIQTKLLLEDMQEHSPQAASRFI